MIFFVTFPRHAFLSIIRYTYVCVCCGCGCRILLKKCGRIKTFGRSILRAFFKTMFLILLKWSRNMHKICLYITPDSPERNSEAFDNEDSAREAPWWTKEKGCYRRYRKAIQLQEDGELLMNMRNCRIVKDPQVWTNRCTQFCILIIAVRCDSS